MSDDAKKIIVEQWALECLVTLVAQMQMLEVRYTCRCRNELLGQMIRPLIREPCIVDALLCMERAVKDSGDI